MKLRPLLATQDNHVSASQQFTSLDQMSGSPSRNETSTIHHRYIGRYLSTQAEKSMFHKNGFIDPVEQRSKERGERYVSPYSLARLGTINNSTQLPNLTLQTKQTKLARHEQRIDMVNKNVFKAETQADAINYFAKKFELKMKGNEPSRVALAARYHSRERSFDSQDSIKISEGSMKYHNKLVKQGGRQPDNRQTFLDFISLTTEFQAREQRNQKIHRQATEKQFSIKLNKNKMINQQLSRPTFTTKTLRESGDSVESQTGPIRIQNTGILQFASTTTEEGYQSLESTTQNQQSMQFDLAEAKMPKKRKMEKRKSPAKLNPIFVASQSSTTAALTIETQVLKQQSVSSLFQGKKQKSGKVSSGASKHPQQPPRNGSESPPQIQSMMTGAQVAYQIYNKKVPKQNILDKLIHNRSNLPAGCNKQSSSNSMRNLPSMKKLMQQKSTRRFNVVAGVESVFSSQNSQHNTETFTAKNSPTKIGEISKLNTLNTAKETDYFSSELTGNTNFTKRQQVGSLNDGVSLGDDRADHLYIIPPRKSPKIKAKAKNKLGLKISQSVLTSLAQKPLHPQASSVLSEISLNLNSQFKRRDGTLTMMGRTTDKN